MYELESNAWSQSLQEWSLCRFGLAWDSEFDKFWPREGISYFTPLNENYVEDFRFWAKKENKKGK